MGASIRMDQQALGIDRLRVAGITIVSKPWARTERSVRREAGTGRLGGGAVIQEVGQEGRVGRTVDLFVVCDLRKGLYTKEPQVTMTERPGSQVSGLGAGR